jgi:hypothetical protein
MSSSLPNVKEHPIKLAAVSILTLSLASALMGDLKSGVIVPSGQPFPIVADFNGDGLDDLIQGRSVILNDGKALTDVRDLGFEGETIVGVLDVNGDHILDLLTVGTPVMVPANLPQPTMQAPGYRLYIGDASRKYPTAIGISTGARPYIADVDGDGKDDFVILADVRPDGIRTTATDVTVLRSRGDGTFDRLETIRIAPFFQIMPDYRVLSGDLNHDGLPDLVIRCVYDLVVLRGTGGGKFAVETRHLPSNRSFGSQSARLGDIDGDGNLDVILPALRGIRVFFGDGRGNFPRTTQATIAKAHEIELPPGSGIQVPNNINEPRDLALGHFTRNDRMQIAAGTVEGDLVVFSYEQDELREISRNRTEFWHLDIRSGSFRGAGSDIYVMGTLIWGDMYPRPRLFYGAENIASNTSARQPGRRRAVHSDASELAVRIQMHGECIDESSAQWRFARDGAFGVAKRGDTTIEAVFDGPSIYFRLSAPYAKEPVMGVLTEESGSYAGTADVLTDCGAKVMTVNAKLE